MDITQTVTVASLAGAGLFFAGGYLARSLRRGAAPTAAEPGSEVEPRAEAATRLATLGRARDQLAQELEHARSSLKQAEAARDRLGAERDALARRDVEAAGATQSELSRLRSAVAQQEEAAAKHSDEAAGLRAELKRQTEQAKQARADQQRQAEQAKQARADQQRQAEEAKQAQAELLHLREAEGRTRAEQARQAQDLARAQQQAEQALAESKREAARRAEFERELDRQQQALGRAVTDAQRATAESQARVAQLEQQLATAEARAALRGTANEGERLEALRGEHAELTRQLEQLRASTVPAEEVEQLRGKQRHMLVQARLMQQQLGEMEQHARENVGLKQQLELAQAQLAAAEQLTLRLRRAEARLLAAGVAVDEGAPQSRPVASSAPSGAPRAIALEAQLARLVAPGSAHAVVLADERGLQLAAAGTESYHEALAVLSASVAELGQTASALLPFDAGRSLQLMDRNGLSIDTRMFEAAGQGFVVAALGASLERRPELEQVMAAVTAIVEQ